MFSNKYLYLIAMISMLSACGGGSLEQGPQVPEAEKKTKMTISEAGLGMEAGGAGSGPISAKQATALNRRFAEIDTEIATNGPTPLDVMPNKRATLHGFAYVAHDSIAPHESRSIIGNMTIEADFNVDGNAGRLTTHVSDLAQFDSSLHEETGEFILTRTPNSRITGGALTGSGRIEEAQFASTLTGDIETRDGAWAFDGQLDGRLSEYNGGILAKGVVSGEMTDHSGNITHHAVPAIAAEVTP